MFPGADEYCDDVDRDCDGDPIAGAVDASSWWDDSDEDGFGGEALGLECEAPTGAVGNGDDCDDSLARVNPDADEICDGIDTDCDATTGEDGTASFVDTTGTWEDVTDEVDGTAGDPDIFDIEESGTLNFCAGTWYTYVDVEASVVTIAGQSSREDTVLNGSGVTRVINGGDSDSLTVSNLSIINGRAEGDAPGGNGGCLVVYNGDLIMDQVSFDGCEAGGYGGAAHARDFVTVVADGLSVTNSTSQEGGGGLSVGAYSTLDLNDSFFAGNTAANGGAVTVGGLASGTISNTTFSLNGANEDGGAVYTNGGYLTLITVDVDENVADGIDESSGYGGGVYVENGTLDIDGSTIQNNFAYAGGGVFVKDILEGEVMSIVSTSITDNSVDSWGLGGGICVANRTDVLLDTVTVARNTAYGGGGMIQLAGSLETIDTLFDGNSARYGGGLHVSLDADGHDDFAYSCAITSSGVSGGFLNNAVDYYGGAALFENFENVSLAVEDCDFGEEGSDANIAEGTCPDMYVSNVEEGIGGGVCDLTNEATFLCDSSSCVITDGETPPI